LPFDSTNRRATYSWFFLSFSATYIDSAIAGPEETKNQRENVLRLIQIRLSTSSFEKISLGYQDNSPRR